jgi:hypothetical protein
MITLKNSGVRVHKHHLTELSEMYRKQAYGYLSKNEIEKTLQRFYSLKKDCDYFFKDVETIHQFNSASIKFQVHVIYTLQKNGILYPNPSGYIIGSTLNDFKFDQKQENIMRPCFRKKIKLKKFIKKVIILVIILLKTQ